MSIFRSSQYLDYGFRIPLGVIFKKNVYYGATAKKKKKRDLSSIHDLFLVEIIIYCNICLIQIGKKSKVVKGKNVF